MTTPTDRVRAALEDIVHAAFEHGNKCLSGKTLDPDGELLGAAKEALSELDGKVLVPVEPTREMLNAAVDVDTFRLGDISPLGFRISPQRLFEKCYAAMIAPYVEAIDTKGKDE